MRCQVRDGDSVEGWVMGRAERRREWEDGHGEVGEREG